jgi:hypothetical protein
MRQSKMKVLKVQTWSWMVMMQSMSDTLHNQQTYCSMRKNYQPNAAW